MTVWSEDNCIGQQHIRTNVVVWQAVTGCALLTVVQGIGIQISRRASRGQMGTHRSWFFHITLDTHL